MATFRFTYPETGSTLNAIVTRRTDDYQLDEADGQFRAVAADNLNAMTENVPYLYDLTFTAANGTHDIAVFDGADLVYSESVPIGDDAITAGLTKGEFDAKFSDARAAYLDNLSQGLAPTYDQVDALNDVSAADVQTASEAALAAYGVPTFVQMQGETAALDKLDTMVEADGLVYKFTKNALEESPADQLQFNSAGEVISDSPTVEQIDSYLSGIHGAGVWGVAFSLPAMNGKAYTATAIQKRTVTIVEGDSPTITFTLNSDYSGWTIEFGAKPSHVEDTYTIGPVAGVWTDASTGVGYVALSASDTSVTPGTYQAEIQLSNGTARSTVIKFTLVVEGQIVTT